MAQPEFVRIDNQAVRVTSLKTDETTGTVDLVIVARGTAAATFLADLANKETVSLEIPDESTDAYSVKGVDIHSTGSGEQSMKRARFTLVPASLAPPSENLAESQLDRIECKLDQILAELGRKS